MLKKSVTYFRLTSLKDEVIRFHWRFSDANLRYGLQTEMLYPSSYEVCRDFSWHIGHYIGRHSTWCFLIRNRSKVWGNAFEKNIGSLLQKISSISKLEKCIIYFFPILDPTCIKVNKTKYFAMSVNKVNDKTRSDLFFFWYLMTEIILSIQWRKMIFDRSFIVARDPAYCIHFRFGSRKISDLIFSFVCDHQLTWEVIYDI